MVSSVNPSAHLPEDHIKITKSSPPFSPPPLGGNTFGDILYNFISQIASNPIFQGRNPPNLLNTVQSVMTAMAANLSGLPPLEVHDFLNDLTNSPALAGHLNDATPGEMLQALIPLLSQNSQYNDLTSISFDVDPSMPNQTMSLAYAILTSLSNQKGAVVDPSTGPLCGLIYFLEQQNTTTPPAPNSPQSFVAQMVASLYAHANDPIGGSGNDCDTTIVPHFASAIMMFCKDFAGPPATDVISVSFYLTSGLYQNIIESSSYYQSHGNSGNQSNYLALIASIADMDRTFFTTLGMPSSGYGNFITAISNAEVAFAGTDVTITGVQNALFAQQAEVNNARQDIDNLYAIPDNLGVLLHNDLPLNSSNLSKFITDLNQFFINDVYPLYTGSGLDPTGFLTTTSLGQLLNSTNPSLLTLFGNFVSMPLWDDFGGDSPPTSLTLEQMQSFANDLSEFVAQTRNILGPERILGDKR